MSTRSTNLKALVVDDDFEVVRVVSMVLRNMGVENIEHATDGVIALEKLNDPAGEIDFIICDWMMPYLSGLDFLREVRGINAKIPFLMLTAKSDPNSIIEAKNNGVSTYITKPIAPDRLEEKIKETIGGLG